MSNCQVITASETNYSLSDTLFLAVFQIVWDGCINFGNHAEIFINNKITIQI